jgi:hypothetical protein
LAEADEQDYWLSVELHKAIRRLWVLGPSSVPEVEFNLPSDHIPSPPPSSADGTDTIYADPRYSLNNGLDVFTRYHSQNPGTPPIHLLTMIGTADLCYVGCKVMQERLAKLGSEVVKADFIVVSCLPCSVLA